MHSNHTASSGHEELAPSAWVTRFGQRVTVAGRILDVACGAGRHAHWFAGQGFLVDAVDRADLPKLSPRIAFKRADIEADPWPYAGKQFAAVVVANYLHRPLMNTLVESVAPEGWLIYETFSAGNEQFGRPSRADFLLQPEELLHVVHGRLTVVAYENGFVDTPKPAMVQRIAAQYVSR